MRSPIAALTWDVWVRHRTLIQLAAGITVFSCVFNSVLPDSVRESKPDAGLVNFHLTAAVFLLLLAIFGYTEFNPQKGSSGFPHRLFVLPVTSFQLVAVPMILGVAAMEIVVLLWTLFVLTPDERSIWTAIQLGVYMVLYQTVLWTLASLKAFRTLVLGLLGVITIMLRAFPFVRRLPDATLIAWLVGVALAGVLISWAYVARERSGGSSRGWTGTLFTSVACRMPTRRRVFRSAQAAQFWFEWRRSGSILPLLVGSLLGLVIFPLSWYHRNAGDGSLWILVATLAMPMILALAVGKAFSKPDFWSKELSIPGFIAVRPLATVDMVAIRLRVAAVSTAVSWLLVLAFLSLWLPFWANHDSLAMVRGTLWMIHGHVLYPQYTIAALGFFAGILLTWRFLVGGLWLGLSGNTKVFALSAIPYVLVPFFGIPAIVASIEFHEPILVWLQRNAGQWLGLCVWITAGAFVMKMWAAVFFWRTISGRYIRKYLTFWLGCSACLVALAFLLAGLLNALLPADSYRLRNLLIFIALQVIPLARVGLAPAFLAKSRHD